MTQPLLHVRALEAWYGQTKVLHGIDICLQAGRVATVLGANGAGKTTLLRSLCQMMVRTSGSIELEGRSLADKATQWIARQGVGHVPDGRGTFLALTVEENLRLGGIAIKDQRKVREQMERMYGLFPRLKERARQQAGTLSGGEQQMLAISRALMPSPKLLLLDEPSFGLAPLVVQDIFGIMQRVRNEDGISILLVEQNANLALQLADDAYLIESGRVVIAGSSASLRANDAVRRAYLGH